MSIGLFVLTTEPRAFVLDLERRGVSPRFAFVAVGHDRGGPDARRAGGDDRESQRARGLDTEGSVRARLRGLLPLVGPVILGVARPRSRSAASRSSRAPSAGPGRRHCCGDARRRGWERVAALARSSGSSLVACIAARIAGQL